MKYIVTENFKSGSTVFEKGEECEVLERTINDRWKVRFKGSNLLLDPLEMVKKLQPVR